MKKYKKLAALALSAILLTLLNGCIPSLYPIYTADKLVLLSGLPGSWQEEKGEDSMKPEHWTFKQGEEKGYLLIHVDGVGHLAAFDVHVVKLGSHYFMDFYPTNMPDKNNSDLIGNVTGFPEKMNSFLEIHLLAVHTFAKVELSGKSLKISMFDPDFLKNMLENQQIRIKHEKSEDGYLLTASPTDLQKFAEKYAEVDEAFLDEPLMLKLK